MIRALQILGTTKLGGAESRIMELYRLMDKNRVQFDFLVHMDGGEYKRALRDGVNPVEYREPEHYDEEIYKLGGNIYALPRFKVYNYFSYKRAVKDFFEKHHDYTVAHGHMTSTAAIYLPVAKKAGIKYTVAHTRSAGVDPGIKGKITKIMRKSLYKKADSLFACSRLAGELTFEGHPFEYVPNTIDTLRFEYSEESRSEIRTKYNIPDDTVVIGHVGSFREAKNHIFLLKTYKEFVSGAMASNINTMLFLCGDGPLRSQMEDIAISLGIADSVIFAGNQSEVEKYYSAFDIFAFPSIYEGLPGSVVEAQAAGLVTIVSDRVTNEVILTDRAVALGIDSVSDWAKAFEKYAGLIMNEGLLTEGRVKRKEYVTQIKNAGFDVHEQASKMMAFYLEPCKNNIP